MVSPAAAGGPSASFSMGMPEPPLGEEAAKLRCRPARVISMGVQCCMTAALLSAFGVFIVMMPLVLAARALRRQGRRYLAFSPDDHPPPWPRQRHVSLASEQISRLPSFESSPYDRNSACVVCLEASRGGERWRALPPCGHAFHAACVDPWLLLSPVCPVCRATVAVPPTGESQAQAADDMETPPPPIYLSLSPPHASDRRRATGGERSRCGRGGASCRREERSILAAGEDGSRLAAPTSGRRRSCSLTGAATTAVSISGSRSASVGLESAPPSGARVGLELGDGSTHLVRDRNSLAFSPTNSFSGDLPPSWDRVTTPKFGCHGLAECRTC